MPAVTVITGGAGGIGFAAAEIIGRVNPVVICDISRDRLDAAIAELEQLDITCTAVTCDITDPQSVAELFQAASALGKITSVIHAAGVSPSMGDTEMILRINALGTVNINAAFRALATNGSAIVNVASMAAHTLPENFVFRRLFQLATKDPAAFLWKATKVCRIASKKLRPGLAYALSKRFVLWYSASQAAEFGRAGARIVSVSPGSIDTRMGRLEEQSGSGAMAGRSALQRFGRPEEIAELLAFCASAKAGYLTGTDILCDGGVTAALTLRDKMRSARNVS
jgi:NAD(P)-dependent dehydrogenase (short-subunit alcohol dehydrogenase family)